MTARYGQLTYTSFARAGKPGGWQVKETGGGVTPAEVDLLVAGIHTGFTPVQPLPPYPTREQVAAFPRRLSYRRFDNDTAAYWHIVPAGADGSGRPGNVFAHVLLDRQAARNEPRPIELWCSPQWLTPYGPKAVLAATLSDLDPVAGTVVTAEQVARFVGGPDRRRLAVLGVLLDAVAAALAGGPPAVLGTESAARAAQWIGAVSFLMSPAAARRLSFSTFDRATDLGYAPGAGQHLIAVPRGDLPEVPAGLTVIDETATGPPVPAGTNPLPTWSTLARSALADPASVAGLLADIDRVSAQRAGQAGSHPGLPMAFAVLGRPASAGAAVAARAVVAAHAPPALRTEPVVVGAVDAELDRRIGDTTSDAWRVVAESTGLMADAAAQVYLQRAIVDPDWLGRPGPLPTPGLPAESAAITAALPAAVTAARARGPAQLARVVDLAASCGLTEELGAVVDREIVPALADRRTGPGLVAQLAGRIGRATRLLIAGRLFAALDRPGDWAGLDRSLVGWLADGVPAPDPTELSDAAPGDPVWTAATLRALCALMAGRSAGPDRYLALWWVRRHPTAATGYDLDFGAGPWDPAELLAAVGDGPLPAGACIATLLGAPDSADLTALAERVLSANTEAHAVACAVVRAVPPADWLANGYVETHYRAYTPYWDQVIGEAGAAAVHDDFAVRFLVLGALAAASGIAQAAACQPLMADPAVATRAARELESTEAENPLSRGSPHPTARRWMAGTRTRRGR